MTMVYAVIDTNVVVSALISHNKNAATVQVIKQIFLNKLIPLYNDEILKEYVDVLHRSKFKLTKNEIDPLIDTILEYGIDSNRVLYNDILPDEDDRIFYEVSLSKENSFLVTGNLKHFPKSPFVVTPAQMLEIILNE